MKEFNLSEKMSPMILFEEKFNYLKEKDVREFIRRLKEEINQRVSLSPTDEGWIDFVIDKLAGSELAHSPHSVSLVKHSSENSESSQERKSVEYANEGSNPSADTQTQDEICSKCGGLKKIRNPTGHCDHLYYPDNIETSDKKACENCGILNTQGMRLCNKCWLKEGAKD